MRLALRLILCFFIAFSTSSTVFAAPSIREQAIEISKELRDPGAVNQSLYESNAPQAAELKAKIYQLLENGESQGKCVGVFCFSLRKANSIRSSGGSMDRCALGCSRRTFCWFGADSTFPYLQT